MQISAIDVVVGRRLRVLRISQGFEPDAFAAALAIAPERLHCYENGEARIPPRVLRAMADLLHVPMQAFFDPSHAKVVYDNPPPPTTGGDPG
jgi:transcriptional regulator with XRE-family HTH domain